jgi:sugar (pentulose or hexulose) kinase
MHLSIKTSTAPKSATDADIMRSPFESRTLDFYMDLRILEDAEGERPARLEAAAYIAGAAEYLRVRAGPAKAIAVLEEIRVALSLD